MYSRKDCHSACTTWLPVGHSETENTWRHLQWERLQRAQEERLLQLETGHLPGRHGLLCKQEMPGTHSFASTIIFQCLCRWNQLPYHWCTPGGKVDSFSSRKELGSVQFPGTFFTYIFVVVVECNMIFRKTWGPDGGCSVSTSWDHRIASFCILVPNAALVFAELHQAPCPQDAECQPVREQEWSGVEYISLNSWAYQSFSDWKVPRNA